MNCLDLISGSPRFYIFGKRTNETNLGGLFTIIFVIVLIFTAVSYLYDFYHNATYEYSYFYKNIRREDRTRLKEKYNLNPVNNFTIEIRDINNNIINDKFIFSYFDDGPILIDFNGTLSINIDKYASAVFYKCYYEKPDNICLGYKSETFELNIYYESKIFDHENPDCPVRNSSINYVQKFSSDYMSIMEAYWGIYNYEEKKGIIAKIFDNVFQNENNYTFGQIDGSQTYSIGDMGFMVIMRNFV